MTIYLGGRRTELFADTGSKFTIIPPSMYHSKMGKVKAANCILRAWGSNSTLDVKGMVRTEIRTEKGARRRSWVYIVGGHKPETLLGDRDAEALGIVLFDSEGRDPTFSELDEENTMTKYHVPTSAEVRHDLENAAVFSELDMGYGYHLIPLHPESAKMAVFQSH